MKNLNSIWLGLKKGYKIETLPKNVRTFLELPLVRIFRVIGGICVLIYLLNKNGTVTLNLPYNLNMIIYIIALIQFILIFIISVWKIVYGINKLLYHKEEFEVRNSPLNRLASMTGHLLYCWKVGIQTASVGLTIILVYLVIDVLRVNVVNIAASPVDNINVIVNINFIMFFSKTKKIRLIFNSFKDKFNNQVLLNWNRNIILNIFSWGFILFIIYKLIIGLTIIPAFGSYVFIISLICSFIISHYISKKFSSNFIIRLLQKYVLLNIVIFVFSIIYGCFILPEIYCVDEELDSKNKQINSNEEAGNSNSKNRKVHLNIESVNKGGKEMYDVNFQIDKESADNLMRRGGKVVKEGFERTVPYIGAAAGKVGSTAYTALKRLPPAQRVVGTGVVVGVTAGSTVLGIEGGKAILKNKTIEESIKNSIKNSKHADISKDRIPSPDTDNYFVNSPFEANIPLVTLLNAIWTLNIFELILMVILVWLLFNKYLKYLSFNISRKIVYKYMGDNFIEKFEKYQKKFEEFNNKFSIVMYMWVGLLLIIIKLVNIFFSGVLYYDIDNYVLVYNHYKNI
jgi:general stress protein YciG